MTDQSFRGREKVVETDTQTNLLDYFVGIFGIDVIFNSLSSTFSTVCWSDLYKVCDFGLVIWDG